MIHVECIAITDEGTFVAFTIGEEEEPEMMELEHFISFSNKCIDIQDGLFELLKSVGVGDDGEDDR